MKFSSTENNSILDLSNKQLLLIGAATIAIVLLVGVPITAAGTAPAGTWDIYYYAAGTNCTGSPYSPTAKDGGGFAANQPSTSNEEPIVATGGSIDVQIVVTGGAHNGNVSYEVDSVFGPINIGTLDSNGNGTFCFTVTMPESTAGACHTTPQKISVNGADFDGNIIDHFFTGTECGTGPGTSNLTTTVVDEGPGSLSGSSPPTADAGNSFHDTANLTVSGGGGAGPTGNVTYSFFNTLDCSGANTTSIGTVGGTAASPTVGNSASTGPLEPGNYSYHAVYSGDQNYLPTGSACEPFIIVAFAQPPSVTKEALGNYTTTYIWNISKAVTPGEIDTAPHNPATFNYTVIVTHDNGTISDIVVYGTIFISNPNPLPMTITSVNDTLSDGTTCSVFTGSLVIAAGGNTTFSYTCSDSNSSLPESNTAWVAWSSGGVSDTTPSNTASITWNQTLVDDSVTVTDTLGGVLGTCSAITDPTGCTFTYTETFKGTPDTCTNYPNTAMFTTDTTQTTGTASANVKVCVGENLTMNKTATAIFSRTYTWSIFKTVHYSQLESTAGTSYTLHYKVVVAQTGFVDSGWSVIGKIQVTNPNNWESVAVTLSDSTPGGSCIITPANGFTGNLDGSVNGTIPASTRYHFSYVCTFLSNPGSGINTATTTWNSTAASTRLGSAHVDVSYTFGAPTSTFDKKVTVTDSFAGTLGHVKATDTLPFASKAFKYSLVVVVNGCATINNTATIVQTGQTATSSITLCGSGPTGGPSSQASLGGATSVVSQSGSGVLSVGALNKVTTSTSN
jgi:hypothetical protein